MKTDCDITITIALLKKLRNSIHTYTRIAQSCHCHLCEGSRKLVKEVNKILGDK